LEGIPLELVDTAGLREGLHGSLEELSSWAFAAAARRWLTRRWWLVVLTQTEALNDEERRLLAAVEGRPALVAVNKSDLMEGRSRAARLRRTADAGDLGV